MTTFRWPGLRLEFVISDGKAPPPIPVLLSCWSPAMGNGKHLNLYKSSNSYCTRDFSQTGQTWKQSQYLQLLELRHFLGWGAWDLLSLEAVGNINIFSALSWFPAPQITMLKTKPDFHCHFQAGLTCAFNLLTSLWDRTQECSGWASLILVDLGSPAEIPSRDLRLV